MTSLEGGFDMVSIERLRKLYDAYVDTFRVEGELPPMMALKRVHTAHVVENAVEIARGERFPAAFVVVCEAAALLHDTGRYEQLRLYNTFRDSESVDHSVFSREVVEREGWLDECGEGERRAVLDAVLFHNRREIPEGLDDLTLAAAQTVRDADKLDIFRVMEDRVENSDWRNDSTAFWNLPLDVGPNKAVLDAIREGRPVDYQNIASLADFVLVQVGWMVSGLAYATSRRLCAGRGHLEFRRGFLHQLTDDPAVDELCDLAGRALVA